ncbi:hypothetical protein RRF57_002950 [Xylaria bambusicola]|uniref:Uncharacterized protein n=1 Tax=Xylaria bambusicola TaxID=326684 RepID=A0AAN7U7X5_9PEZI
MRGGMSTPDLRRWFETKRDSHIADAQLSRNDKDKKGTGRRRYLYNAKRTERIQQQRAARSLSGGEPSAGGK